MIIFYYATICSKHLSHHLRGQNLFKLCFVCKQWSRLTNLIFQQLFLPFREKADNYLHRFSDTDRLRLQSFGTIITERSLSKLTNLTFLSLGQKSSHTIPGLTDTLQKSLKTLTNLTYLSFNFSLPDPNFDWLSIFPTLPNLTFLAAPSIGSVSSFQNLPQLQTLQIWEGYYLKKVVSLPKIPLPDLTGFIFEGSIAKSIINRLTRLTRLTTLDLKPRAGYMDSFLDHLPMFTTLTFLSLEGTGSFPFVVQQRHLDPLMHLTKLELTHRVTLDGSLTSLSNLRSLSIVGNGKIDDQHIKSLTALTYLDTRYTINISTDAFELLSNLKGLRISETRNIKFGRSLPRLAPKLAFLGVATDSGSSSFDPDSLLDFPSLTYLCVESGTVRDATVKQLTKLTTLALVGGSPISGEAVQHLTGLTRLSYRSLKLDSLRHLKNLKELYVKNEDFEIVTHFRTYHPNVKIFLDEVAHFSPMFDKDTAVDQPK